MSPSLKNWSQGYQAETRESRIRLQANHPILLRRFPLGSPTSGQAYAAVPAANSYTITHEYAGTHGHATATSNLRSAPYRDHY